MADQDFVNLNAPSTQLVVDLLNTGMAPYFRLKKDPGDAGNADTFKLEMHSPDGKFRMPFFSNSGNLNAEAPRV